MAVLIFTKGFVMNQTSRLLFFAMRFAVVMACLSAPALVLAQTSALEQSARWAQAAKNYDPAFKPSAVRGQALFNKQFSHNQNMPSCTSCHTSNLADQGRHVITNKSLAPMVARGQNARFTEASKTDKWLKRNCSDVIGRDCYADEKADLLLFFSLW
jgi:cytochrome c peroxidase